MGSVQNKANNLSSDDRQAAVIAIEDDDSDDEFVDCSSEIISNNLDSPSSEIISSSDGNSRANDDEIMKIKQNHLSDDDDDESAEERKERQQRELEEFHEEMNRKRELRQKCMQKLRAELIDLREKLSNEMMINEQLREERGTDKSLDDLIAENKRLKIELSECQMYLQTSNAENINATLETQALRDHIRSLKEVIKATKEMLSIRELQVDQMKSKLTEIETSFADKEAKIMSTALQQEYQRQLENIRNMRELYEQRANLIIQERNSLQRQLDDKELDLRTEIEKSKNLEDYIVTLENNIKAKNTDISMLESQISQLKIDKAQVGDEMNAINQLISHVLFDFNACGSNIDIDTLYKMLEQNRDLLNEMAIKEDYSGIDEGYFLPKLLYDLFLQVNQSTTGEEVKSDAAGEIDKSREISTPEEIASKLPKVWRVLIELFNHHNRLNDEEVRVFDDCYKSIQTASGSQAVLSVSKTFMKLRDLILEKRSLQKDTTRLKTLYSHLEQRLDKQEKRLSAVSLELTKTWHLVGKIKRQHRQLHTHEQILCYQLQQKRRLINELKAELEYCRKKWALARAINNESEEQCRQMRKEFSLRKIQDQNSGESGYSDEHEDEDDKITKSERFDRNLVLFDRTASPTYTERRRSESPMPKDFTNLCIFSRAQSEPPQNYERSISNKDVEVQDFVTDSLPCEEAATQSHHEENPQVEILVVQSPPVVHDYDNKNPPKVKVNLRKKKKEKIKKNGQTETAEEMFLRLMSVMNGENSTSSTTVDDDELDLENIEDIPLDPLPEVLLEETKSEASDDFVHVENIPEVMIVESQDEPSTSTATLTTPEQDYLERREARLARLEAEAKEFYEKMTRNKEKRIELTNKLTNVHQNFLDREKRRTQSEENDSSDDDSNDENVDEQKTNQKDDGKS